MIYYEGLKRVVIDNIYPQIDYGEFPIKRCLGDCIRIEADIFADGHDDISAYFLVKHINEENYNKIRFDYIDNDRWGAEFTANKIGIYHYKILAYIDDYKSWRKKILEKIKYQQEINIDLQEGQNLIETALSKLNKKNNGPLKKITSDLNKLYNPNLFSEQAKLNDLIEFINNPLLTEYVSQQVDEKFISESSIQEILVERSLANFSSWYEIFPRSWAQKEHQHGTLNDVSDQLSYIKELGFNIIYLTPIHPIGFRNRKGKNNSVTATANDPGSPWAIGSPQGGHCDIHPELGTLDDFKKLINNAKAHDLEIAMDFALQCSADHPYLKNHSEWFKIRPDGSLQYAENPPKKYQDIYPFNFASKDWQNLWQEIKLILEYWIQLGVTIFRVDNPHTKPFSLWRWVIIELKKKYPETIFLSEAFTRPKVKYYLAKCGFSQSYTYFTWRNSKFELIDYFNELNSEPLRQYFRANLWPNTPDILHEYLQKDGKNAFLIRFTLAATLGSNYGIYGPAFEFCLNKPVKEGSEEYINSEKYEIKYWQIENKTGLQSHIQLVNQIRKQHKALQNFNSLKFQTISNEHLIAYSKHDPSHNDILLIIINLDYSHQQTGNLIIDLQHIGIHTSMFELTDLLSNQILKTKNGQCLLTLNPNHQVAYIFRVKKIIVEDL